MRLDGELKRLFYLLVLSFSPILMLGFSAKPASAAFPGIDNFVNAFSWKGQLLEAIFKNEYAVFGLTVLFLTYMMYNVFVVLIAKIPVFAGGEGKSPANKYGRVVSFCLACMCSLGIFAYMAIFGHGTSVREMISGVLGPFSTLAGIVLALLVFGLTYYGFKDMDTEDQWKRSLWAVGLAILAVGSLLSRPGLFALGWLIVFIMMLWAFFKLLSGNFSGSGSGSGGGGKDDPSKKARIEGIVLDEVGDTLDEEMELTAYDESNNPIGGAKCTCAASTSTFVLEFHVPDKLTLGDVKGKKGDTLFTAGFGHVQRGGRKVEGIKLSKNSTTKIKNVVVCPDAALKKFKVTDAAYHENAHTVTFDIRRDD